jgi:hypothetical protein
MVVVHRSFFNWWTIFFVHYVRYEKKNDDQPPWFYVYVRKGCRLISAHKDWIDDIENPGVSSKSLAKVFRAHECCLVFAIRTYSYQSFKTRQHSSARNASAKEWPSNYNMLQHRKQYCLKQFLILLLLMLLCINTASLCAVNLCAWIFVHTLLCCWRNLCSVLHLTRMTVAPNLGNNWLFFESRSIPWTCIFPLFC